MRRPTREQVDEEILDAAAALFARHGFEQTSLQRVADSAGYSKTGLLHRFPTKETLVEATTNATARRLEGIVEAVAHLPAGAQRDLAVIAELTALTRSRAGFVALVLSVLSAEAPAAPGRGVAEIGRVLFRAFAASPPEEPGADVARALRITVAVGGLAVASLACREQPEGAVRPHLVAAAAGALGHHRTPEED